MGTWRAHRARMAHASFEHFRAQWIPVAHSAASVRALAVLATKEPTVAALGKDDLGQLVDALCGDARSVDPVSADRAIGAMVASQLLDPLIALAVVMALTPGLKVVARRLEWGAGGPWGHPEVFSGDLMTTAWEVVAAWEGRRREFMAPALLHAVRMRLDRRAQAWRREMGRRTDWEEVCDPEGSAESAPEQLARLLEDAADRIVSRRDASVVYAHRVLGLTMVELAAMTGHSRQALDRCRARAERRLCA
jgi:hypothetical protein